jgi:hypothetical protein
MGRNIFSYAQRRPIVESIRWVEGGDPDGVDRGMVDLDGFGANREGE